MTYQTLSHPVSSRFEIKKSQFITYAYPVQSREQAMQYVDALQQKYPDARHHCWAYIIGDPNNTTSAGFDDDGEPSGTAGRPILNVLQHKAIGNIIVIVVRYFGGIKLGAGGLTRAYAAATQAAVDNMVLAPYIALMQIKIKTDFANESQIRYVIDDMQGYIIDVNYDKAVTLTVTLPEANLAKLADRIVLEGEVMVQKEAILHHKT